MTTSTPTTDPIRRRKVGTYLMLAFTVGWIVTMLGVQIAQSRYFGFGSGFGDGGRVPPAIVQQAGVGSEAAAVVAATSHNAPNHGPLKDAWLLLSSLAILGGITGFWYLVMSRIGTF